MNACCRTYLENCLISVGVKRVFNKQEDTSRHQVLPFAQVVEDSQSQIYDGSVVARFNGPAEDERTFRQRIYHCTVEMLVKIVHRDLNQAEAIRDQLLKQFDRRILDEDGNAILVTSRGAEPEEDGSILQNKAASYLDISFEGGIYKDKVVKLYNLDVALEMEPQIIKEDE